MLSKFSSEPEAVEAAGQEVHNLLGQTVLSHTKLKEKLLLASDEHRKSLQNLQLEISGAMQRQIDEHRKAISLLHQANPQGLHSQLGKLINLVPSSAANYKALINASQNIKLTLEVIAPFRDVAKTIRDLQAKIQADGDLAVAVSEGLKLSEIKSKILAAATPAQRESLKHKFQPFKEFEVELINYMSSVIENCITVAQKQPEAIIRVVRVIMKHEGEGAVLTIRKYLDAGISKRLNKRFESAKDIESLANVTIEAVGDIRILMERVLQCFPVEFQLQSFFINSKANTEYRNFIENKITPYLDQISEIRESPGMLVLIASWLDSYASTMTLYSPDIVSDLQFQMIVAKVKELMPDFLQHIENLLKTWVTRESDRDVAAVHTEPREQLGPYPENMFNAINQQIEFVADKLKGEMLIEVFRVCTETLRGEQHKQLQRVLTSLTSTDEPDLELARLCLRVNNNARCARHTIDLKDRCKREFLQHTDLYTARIDKLFGDVQKGFLTVSNEGVGALATVILKTMADQGLGPLFDLEWGTARPVASVFVTFEDYDKDLSRWLSGDLYSLKVRRKFIEVFLLAYLEKLLHSMRRFVYFKYEYNLLGLFNFKPPDKSRNHKVEPFMEAFFVQGVRRDQEDFTAFLAKHDLEIDIAEIFDGITNMWSGFSFNASKLLESVKWLTKDPTALCIGLSEAVGKDNAEIYRKLFEAIGSGNSGR
jgi:hypothetical protein